MKSPRFAALTVVCALAAVVSSICPTPVHAADAAPVQLPGNWNDLVTQSDGQSLNLILQPDAAYEETVAAFGREFPRIRVNVTLINPSDAGPRILTEQKNGIYAWDAWWGTAANMNNVVMPAHGLEDLKPYLVLPEVTDPSNWRDPDALYTDPKRHEVFVHTHFLMDVGIINTKLVPHGSAFTLDQLLDPSLKGKISIRVPNRPHGGAMMLAAIAKDKGLQEVRELLTTMSPTYVDNDRQNFMLVSHGGSAIALGIPETILFECYRYGGCKHLKPFPASFMHSRGVCIPKQPPHPAAAAVFVNWLLSREGQREYVKDWAKHNPSGAFSMRKDIPIDPSQADSVPDFSHLDKYVAVSLASGQRDVRQVINLYRDVRSGSQK